MALNVKLIQKLSAPGRYGDGRGLYLHIGKTGGRSWLLRYERAGRERWMGLGSLRDISLAEARDRVEVNRQLLKNGIDPLDVKDAKTSEEAKRLTFAQAAQHYFESHEQKWSNSEHRRQFLSTLAEYAFPVIGKLPVAMIDTPLVLKVLNRNDLWKDKHVTANRVRSRIESVLGWATASGYRIGDNPARWKGHLKEVLPAKGRLAKVEHHAALPYADVPAFMAELRSREGSDARALEFLILTAGRSGEVISARLSEISLAEKVWTVPAERMKARKEHRVPLSDRAIAILKALPREADFVFPGARAGRPLGKMALSNLITAMGSDVTVHGFRSSFRDWAGETTAFPSDICEVALGHAVGGKVQTAYQRGDLLEKRRKLMASWAAFCSMAQRDATVTPIRKRKGA